MRRLFYPLASTVLFFSCAKVLVEHEITLDESREIHQYLKSGKDSTLVMKTVYDSTDNKIEESHFEDLKLEGEYAIWYPSGNKSSVQYYKKGLRIQKGRLIEMQEKIAKDHRVYGVYDVTGDFDSMIVARAKNRKDLDDLSKNLLSMDGILRSVTHLVLNTVKEDPTSFPH